jgi:ribosomal protein S18 acetylase RimI-like enzyme
MEIIKNITAVDSFLVRQLVLRPGKPLESCHFDGDNLETTKHFGLFIDKKLIGIVSVFNNKNTTFISPNQFQIRGMAILPKFQKQGFGEKLMLHCEEYIQNQKGSLTWFNARENAVSFYEKLHYKKIGAPFAIADIGLHYLMKKEIDYPYE